MNLLICLSKCDIGIMADHIFFMICDRLVGCSQGWCILIFMQAYGLQTRMATPPGRTWPHLAAPDPRGQCLAGTTHVALRGGVQQLIIPAPPPRALLIFYKLYKLISKLIKLGQKNLMKISVSDVIIPNPISCLLYTHAKSWNLKRLQDTKISNY